MATTRMAHERPHQPVSPNDAFDDLLHRCWPHQEGWACIREKQCGWCPASGTCVPNTYTIPILAPIYDPDICPLWSERWELRASPLGPHVSTITLLTCVISVLSTFVFIGLLALGIKVTVWLKSRWKARSNEWWKVWRHYDRNWWRGWRLELRNSANEAPEPAETRPLLV